MKLSKPPRFLKVIAGLFDLAIIYLIVFMCIISPIIMIANDIISDVSITMGHMAFGVCLSLLALVMSFLYLWLPPIFFKGATLGMRVFGLKYVSSNHETITPIKLLCNALTLQACFIFTLGFSLVMDLISICLSKDGNTFSDSLNFLRTIKLTKEAY